MKAPPPLPDLSKLTDAQKDELIVSLWQTVIVTEIVAGAAASEDDLRGRIRGTAPSRRMQPRIVSHPGLGRGLHLLDSKLVLGVLLAIGLGFLADFGVGWYQRRALESRNRAELELQNAAFAGLYVELTRVAYEPDGKSYRATLDMQNSRPDVPLYIMLNPVRAFVQVGLTWQEIRANAPNGTTRGVVKLAGAYSYQVVFKADVKDWAELIPGYMHMRVESDMLISQRAEPKDDIVERNNRFYVYLKPQGADDDAIRRRTNFPGTPPIFIPMPPH